ncbi:hypothetical protein R1flu_028570 [Riccia fluitans]|uniref:Uncharacterized protein n=1 Tax=Riccia fluitans TaxID=41844 RepID=A0ABD1XM17_9MARC
MSLPNQPRPPRKALLIIQRGLRLSHICHEKFGLQWWQWKFLLARRVQEMVRILGKSLDEWKSYDDLTKEDIDSVLKPKAYVRGDVINMYIKAKFLGLPRGALYGKFFVNTFWFSRVKTLIDKFQNDPTMSECEDLFIA